MIQLSDLLAAGGQLAGPAMASHFNDWSYDSRLTTPEACFIALRTARADGHDYIPAALAAGASGVLCSWAPPAETQATVILSENPQQLLLRWASARLAHVAPQVIAVTGSVGKTNARRAIAAVLRSASPTFQTRRSFNSLLGLPIAMADLTNDQRFAVLEFGSDQRGEIAQLATYFPPQIGVVTAIGAAHLRSFGSMANIAAEKGDLPAALPASGVAILNSDDPLVEGLAQRTAASIFRFGMRSDCDLRGEVLRYGLDGTQLRLFWQNSALDLHTKLIGEPALTAVLAGIATGLVCGLAFSDCAAALGTLEPATGRLYSLPARNAATLLDDTFSAAPPAADAALRSLALLPARRRIAILGALSDLPIGDEEGFYQDLGRLAAETTDALILKGDWGVIAARAAHQIRPKLPVTVVDTAEAALAALPANLGPDDLILVKGSAEARMEQVSAQLIDLERLPYQGEQPTDLRERLVRQEPAWRNLRIGAPDRATWLRIDLDALAANVRQLRSIAGVPLMAVLKGDAYGHGLIRSARAVLGAGAAAIAVATLGEGRSLRSFDISAPILVLGYTPPWQAEEALRHGLDCTLFDHDAAQAFNKAALAIGKRAKIHVKVDTGMGRLGLRPDEAGPFLAYLRELPGLDVTGLYTHFASADSNDLSSAEQQLNQFTQLLNELTAAGLRPPLVHAANSAASLNLPAARFDMIRPGIACYGLNPSPHVPLPNSFRPVLSFYSEIAQVKAQPPGTPLSYGGTFITSRASQIATIPVGYADGLRRVPAWRSVLIRGQRAPIVGRICMDYALVDVSNIEGVKRGDAVVLIGQQGEQQISADEVADWLGTISYEVLTSILPRVPREVG